MDGYFVYYIHVKSHLRVPTKNTQSKKKKKNDDGSDHHLRMLYCETKKRSVYRSFIHGRRGKVVSKLECGVV